MQITRPHTEPLHKAARGNPGGFAMPAGRVTLPLSAAGLSVALRGSSSPVGDGRAYPTGSAGDYAVSLHVSLYATAIRRSCSSIFTTFAPFARKNTYISATLHTLLYTYITTYYCYYRYSSCGVSLHDKDARTCYCHDWQQWTKGVCTNGSGKTVYQCAIRTARSS